MHEIGVKLVEGTINQSVVEDQANLGLWASILRTKCNFQAGIMLPIISIKWPNRL
jgi:hypothetical protein